jgi:hypothetical protein
MELSHGSKIELSALTTGGGLSFTRGAWRQDLQIGPRAQPRRARLHFMSSFLFPVMRTRQRMMLMHI